MPRKGTISAISGAEDVLDPRRLVIKGSGATYVVNSKISQLIQSDPDLLFLPRGRVSLHEVFMALAKRANVFNNFEEGEALSRPEDVLAMVATATGRSLPDLKAQVVPVGALPNRWVEINGPDRAAIIDECRDYAEAYEPFMEKMFELYKGRPDSAPRT